MLEKYVLETANNSLENSYQCKQKAYSKYDVARKLTNEAYFEMQSAWDELEKARKEMDREYNSIYDVSDYYREVWEAYSRFREETDTRISILRHSSALEQAKMKENFEKANIEYERGDREMAKMYTRDGHDHKGCRDGINEKIASLCQKIKEAREEAEAKAPRPNQEELTAAIKAFKAARKKHRTAREKFLHLKASRDDLWKKFEMADALYKNAQKDYMRKADRLEAAETANSETASSKTEEKPTQFGFFHKFMTTIFK
ncbi:hypothetical protein IKF92_01755 [Candidatus Saccharibacteria bacterium]|nr:hypothetical protein [Candidatus Saccharibacteria bacterium]